MRRHSDGIEAATLPTYRNRYAQYRLDPDLQRLHAEVPALVTWDDHEVQNDYADKWSKIFDDPELFLHSPRGGLSGVLRAHAGAADPVAAGRAGHARLRSLHFGDLIEISMIDGRQYRSREACYAPPNKGGTHLETNASCPERLDAGRTMLGFAQEAWLHADARPFQGAVESDRAGRADGAVPAQAGQRLTRFSTDDWDGYPANRARLLKRIHDTQVSNPVVVGGDMHSFFANDLRLDFDDPASPVVATEFVGTSISSYGPPYDLIAQALPDNPHVHFFESRRRGYVCVDLERAHMQVRMRVVSDAADPKADIATLQDIRGRGRPSGRGGGVDASAIYSASTFSANQTLIND